MAQERESSRRLDEGAALRGADPAGARRVNVPQCTIGGVADCTAGRALDREPPTDLNAVNALGGCTAGTPENPAPCERRPREIDKSSRRLWREEKNLDGGEPLESRGCRSSVDGGSTGRTREKRGQSSRNQGGAGENCGRSSATTHHTAAQANMSEKNGSRPDLLVKALPRFTNVADEHRMAVADVHGRGSHGRRSSSGRNTRPHGRL